MNRNNGIEIDYVLGLQLNEIVEDEVSKKYKDFGFDRTSRYLDLIAALVRAFGLMEVLKLKAALDIYIEEHKSQRDE